VTCTDDSTVGGGSRAAALRPAYQRELAKGIDRFLLPRRPDCPWCGSRRLVERLRTTDLIQRKPGEFVLDRCQDCGHTFQNPRLSPDGLDFYYRDFYDGMGEGRLAGVLTTLNKAVRMITDSNHRRRAGQVLPFAPEPQRWLDVGTSDGEFCAAARALLPETIFDGLDLSDSVERAERQGNVTQGYRGAFPDLAPGLAGRYDVVSMFHYLEHTGEPQHELSAAHQVLRPGGLLLIEVPDPESIFGRLLGRWWLPWLQPQHLHMIPAGNLTRYLTETGFTVLAEQHGEAHLPIDLLAASWLIISALAPPADMPWLPKAPNRVSTALRYALYMGGAPGMAMASVLDHTIALCGGRPKVSNAYRILALREL
jgi:SAM-dependent methyltransferase